MGPVLPVTAGGGLHRGKGHRTEAVLPKPGFFLIPLDSGQIPKDHLPVKFIFGKVPAAEILDNKVVVFGGKFALGKGQGVQLVLFIHGENLLCGFCR